MRGEWDVLPVRKYAGGTPSRHDSSVEAHDESRTVKQHVKSVRYQTKTVRPNPVYQLDKCEALHTVKASSLQVDILGFMKVIER